MRRSFHFWQVIGFGFTSAAGTLLHFLFNWSSENVFIAMFSAVNESIWEHMKLLFFPLFLFAWIEYWIIGKQYENFWCVKLLGTVVGLALIPVLYYTYSGIIGMSIDLINITIFFFAAAVTFRLESRMIEGHCRVSPALSLMLLFSIGFLFVVFTFSPPQLSLFQDPVTGQYGYADQSTDWSAFVLDIDGRVHKVYIFLI